MPLSEGAPGLEAGFFARSTSDPGGRGSRSKVFEEMMRLLAAQGGVREFPVAGGSMFPTLHGVERVRASLDRRRPRFGDIVLFLWDGRLVVHRIVWRGRRGYRTRGDASRGFDSQLLAPDDILGIVTHVIGDGREIDLEGPGAGALRRTVGIVSLGAGLLRLTPRAPQPGDTLVGRARDALLRPLYRGSVAGAFRSYAAFSRAVRRVNRSRPRALTRTLLPYLRPAPPEGWVERSTRSHGADDWRAMTKLATRLGMAPVLLANLRDADRLEAVPAKARRHLERTYYAQALFNTKVLLDLGGLLEDMKREGLEPIVLKGAALAGTLYPSVALRALGDVDLLLRPEELPAADALLRRRGYRQDAREEGESFYASHHHVAPYVPPSGYPRVELHRALNDPRHPVHPDIEGMRSRSAEASFNGTLVRVLCPEDQLIHACLHMALSDRFVRGVKDLGDIDLLARRPGGLRWDRLAESVEAEGIGRPIYYALALARRVFRTPVEEGAWSRLGAHRLPFPEDLLLRGLSRTYLTALPDSEAFFGLSTAKWIMGLLLGDPKSWSRRRRILRGLLGGSRETA